MKLHVLFDRGGRILAAAQIDSETTVQARPMASETEGHRTAEIEVPQEFREHRLADICTKTIVDTAQEIPRLRAGPSET